MADETASPHSRIFIPIGSGYGNSAVIDQDKGALKPQSTLASQPSSVSITPQILPSFSTQAGLKRANSRVAHHTKT
jgi:hypothetical protein